MVHLQIWVEVTNGIPQGSVLGPTLLLIYINDLPDVVHSLVKRFADEAKLFVEVNTLNFASLLQGDLSDSCLTLATGQING